MPFFLSDLFAVGNSAINSGPVTTIFSNPFFGAALATIGILFLAYIIVADMDKMTMARLGIFSYIMMLAVFFVNNTLIMRHFDSGRKFGDVPINPNFFGKDEPDDGDDPPSRDELIPAAPVSTGPPIVVNMPTPPMPAGLPNSDWLSI